MKTAVILAVLFLAFGLAGTVDYQTAAAMAAERSLPAATGAAFSVLDRSIRARA